VVLHLLARLPWFVGLARLPWFVGFARLIVLLGRRALRRAGIVVVTMICAVGLCTA
jgi:hypothetical protein